MKLNIYTHDLLLCSVIVFLFNIYTHACYVLIILTVVYCLMLINSNIVYLVLFETQLIYLIFNSIK